MNSTTYLIMKSKLNIKAWHSGTALARDESLYGGLNKIAIITVFRWQVTHTSHPVFSSKADLEVNKRQRNTPRSGWKFCLLLCLLLLLCSACTEETERPVEQGIARTVILYLAGDNNLSSEVDGRIEQIRTTVLPANARLLAYTDTREDPPQLLELMQSEEGEMNAWNIIRQYEEINSADTATLGSVLREVRSLYPSASYGLIFFSHATGWMPERVYSSFSSELTRSIGSDKRQEMLISDFAAAIPDGMLDFIIFEACYTAGIELMWELKEKTSFTIASSAEVVSPGFATAYSRALPSLFKATADLQGFLRAIEDDCVLRSGDSGSFTFSVVDMSKLDALAEMLIGCDPEPLSDLPASVQSFDRAGKMKLFFDFGDYFSQLLDNTHADALQKAIDECIVYETFSGQFMPSYGGYEIKSHSGFTTYILRVKYPQLNEAYRQLKWYKEVLAAK